MSSLQNKTVVLLVETT